MKNNTKTDENIWINPLGGLGDTLIVSSVLKLVYDYDSTKKFNLIRRTKYLSILKGHPAIHRIGFPPKEATIISTDYWLKEKLGPGNQRAFQILARTFGIKTPIKEVLYMPGWEKADPILEKIIPWSTKNILIAPASDSPRKEMQISHWEHLVEKLCKSGFFVIQVGRQRDRHVRKAYSLLGLTTPRQLIHIIKRCNLVITSDNFAMHAAYLAGTQAVVLWGPTESEIYGYPGQYNIREVSACNQVEKCIAPKLNTYQIPCELGNKYHCMNQISIKKIYTATQEMLL